jgi:ADP-ribose pyrophosphatase YjhB (NUDIX family)
MGKEMRLGDIRVILGNAQRLEDFEAVVTVLFSAGQFVMVRHKDRGWEFPGGRRQGNEACQETAAREIFEETGARIEEIQWVGHYVDSAGRLTMIACAEVSSFETAPETAKSPRSRSLRKSLVSFPLRMAANNYSWSTPEKSGRAGGVYERTLSFGTSHSGIPPACVCTLVAIPVGWVWVVCFRAGYSKTLPVFLHRHVDGRAFGCYHPVVDRTERPA